MILLALTFICGFLFAYAITMHKRSGIAYLISILNCKISSYNCALVVIKIQMKIDEALSREFPNEKLDINLFYDVVKKSLARNGEEQQKLNAEIKELLCQLKNQELNELLSLTLKS